MAAFKTTFMLPQLTLIGKECLGDLGVHMKEMGSGKAVIVTDSFMCKSGVASKVAGILSEQGVDSVVFDGVVPNPTLKVISRLVNYFLSESCDSLVSLGGGSAHDTAKAVKLLLLKGGYSKTEKMILASVNTTAGTGSEVSKYCIVTDEEKHHKLSIESRTVVPDIAVNDPELMLGMPPSLTAATGIDALTHAIEAYTATKHSELTDCTAVKAVELIFNNLPECCKNGGNVEAREGMAYAEYMAGMSFSNAGLGLVHAMAHQLGGVYNLPHGVCNAVLLPFVMEFNFDVNVGRYSEIAKKAKIVPEGLPESISAKNFIRLIRNLNAELKLPQDIKSLKVKEEDFGMLAQQALEDSNYKANSKPATKDDIIGIYKKAYDGKSGRY